MDFSSKMDYIIEDCACANLRKLARIATDVYDRELEPTGLKITQYYMLVNINRHKNISITNLSEMMLLDQTTVTRNVNVLEKYGYVSISKDKHDSRIKLISTTKLGKAKLEEATPLWLQVQRNVEKNIGYDEYKRLLQTLTEVQFALLDKKD